VADYVGAMAGRRGASRSRVVRGVRAGRFHHALGWLRTERLRRSKDRPLRRANQNEAYCVRCRRTRRGPCVVSRFVANRYRTRDNAQPARTIARDYRRRPDGCVSLYQTRHFYSPVHIETPQLAWLVFGTALVWAVIYDTFYAMVDREDDRKVGVKSTALLFGEVDLFVIAGLQLLMVAALTFIGLRAELGFWYYASVAGAAVLMAYHQWLARDRQPAGCFAAFLHNHTIGLVIFIGIVLHYAFTPEL